MRYTNSNVSLRKLPNVVYPTVNGQLDQVIDGRYSNHFVAPKSIRKYSSSMRAVIGIMSRNTRPTTFSAIPRRSRSRRYFVTRNRVDVVKNIPTQISFKRYGSI